MDDSIVLIYILVSILVMIVLGLAVVWFLNRAQMKISNEKIRSQEKEIQFRTELLENTVKTQEQERDRISKELHDDVTSQLSIIHLNMHLLKKKIDKTDSEVFEIVDHIESSLKNSTDRTRSISHELMPSIFRKFGFHHALNELVNSVNIADAVDLQVKNGHLIDFKDFDQQLHLYRIIQELINNSLKYAEADSLKLNFEKNNEKQFHIHYSDNGKGFDQKTVKEGLGTSNIKTRVHLLGGEVEFETSPGHGINVFIKIPNYD